MRPISVHVPDDAYQELKSVAARAGRPVAELIRDAMLRYLDDARQTSRSIFDIETHDSGPLRRRWTRSAH